MGGEPPFFKAGSWANNLWWAFQPGGCSTSPQPPVTGQWEVRDNGSRLVCLPQPAGVHENTQSLQEKRAQTFLIRDGLGKGSTSLFSQPGRGWRKQMRERTAPRVLRSGRHTEGTEGWHGQRKCTYKESLVTFGGQNFSQEKPKPLTY